MSAAKTIQRPRITVVTPVFNEAEGLEKYRHRVEEVLLNAEQADFSVLLVDDGSQDRSWEIIRRICADDARFQALRLSRNFGSHMAISAGFNAAQNQADAIATLACDLQDPPETILDFLQAWQGGASVVWGRRRSRQDKQWRIWTSRLFQTLVRRYAMPRETKFTTGSFLMVDRKVAKSVNQFHEQHRIIFALVAWTGFEQAVVEYHRKPRLTGRSGWTFTNMLKAMFDTFIGFSKLPAQIISWVGLFTFFLSSMLGLYVLINWLQGDPLRGWTTLMLAMTFFFGVLFLLLGIIGQYLHRIYVETTNRPLYFIRDRCGPRAPDDDAASDPVAQESNGTPTEP